MKKTTKQVLTTAGVLGATAAVASLSAVVTTRFLGKVALDREQPNQFRKAQGAISGKKADTPYQTQRQAGTERLQQTEQETVEILARDGVPLIGHWIPQPNARRVIVAIHGWRSSWARDFSLVSRFWEDSGCSVLYAEQRGQGLSGGAYMGFGPIERYDCLNWIQWVRRRCGEEMPVYLAGVSMGATTVLMAAGLELPENVRGILADCGFTSPMEIWKHVARDNLHLSFRLGSHVANAMYSRKIGEDTAAYSTQDALSRSRVPVLLIHGTEDRFVPVEMTYANYEACAGPRRMLIVPGAGHAMSYYVDPVAYETAVREFWRCCDGGNL